MRDKDWEKIFADIEENKESFGRYYPLFRVRIESDGLMDMSIALLINDDLYAYYLTRNEWPITKVKFFFCYRVKIPVRWILPITIMSL